MFLLIVYVTVALASSFFCSILEAALLSVRIGELRERAAAQGGGAALLLEYKEHKVDDAISAILTLNTIAHTVGATLAGAQAAKVWSDSGSTAIGIFGAVLTLLVLVLTEIIPKTLGARYAATLSGFVGRSIKMLTLILHPVLFLTGFLTRLLASSHQQPVSPGELQAMVEMAETAGTIESDASKVLSNVLAFKEVKVNDVMTPKTVLAMAPETITLGDFAADPQTESYSRVPIFKDTRDEVTGYVLTRSVLLALTRGADPGGSIDEFIRPIRTIHGESDIQTSLRQMLAEREHLAIVSDEFGTVVGLLTLEDIVETMLGAEILDEVDKVADLRSWATQMRDRRLARRKRESEEPGTHDEDTHDVDKDPASES